MNSAQYSQLLSFKEFNETLNAFHFYVAKQFANTIANVMPKVSFNNKDISKQWKEHKLLNRFLKINHEVVRQCSLYGLIFVGIVPTKNYSQSDDSPVYNPSITIGLPLEFNFVGFELKRLVVVVDIIKQNFSTFFIVEEWDLDNHFFKREACTTSGERVDLKKGIRHNLNNINGWSPIWSAIPYVPFFANPAEKPDLADVPSSWFKQYDINMKILQTDSIVNKGLLVTNIHNTSNMRNLESLKRALKNPEEILIDYAGFGGVVSDQVFNYIQGQSHAEQLIAKLNFLEKLIKKFGFVRVDTQNLGTKNTISAEVESINSDADDYLEMKANLLEESWTSFFKNVYVPYCVHMNLANINPEHVNVDVEVSGSTKYLKNPANKYVQTQTGVLINPNDLTEKRELKHEKKVQ